MYYEILNNPQPTPDVKQYVTPSGQRLVVAIPLAQGLMKAKGGLYLPRVGAMPPITWLQPWGAGQS
jgi:hypothetical protein